MVSGTTPEEWAARWQLEPFTTACRRCKAPLTTSLPFAIGELRGLVAPQCSCGNPNPPYCVVGAKRDLLEILQA